MKRISACLALLLLAILGSAQVARSAMDQQIASFLQQQFAQKPALREVRIGVDDRVVTLSGTVPSLRDKLNAAHTAEQVQAATGLINTIAVAGPSVEDAALQKTLAERLAYDRVFQGQAFNGLTLAVKNGWVTVGGQVVGYPDRDSALDIIEDTAGVKGVTDKIEVAPVSMMDDRIRMEAARRIYGNSSLSRYANNPALPIRILVKNGNVTLAGVVDSQVDKAVAGNAVRGIPGVFNVSNELVVAH